MDIDTVLEEARARRTLPDPAARRMIRREAGLTLRDVAGVCGVTVAAASRWETGDTNPDRQHAVVYADLLRRLREEVLSSLGERP